MDFKAGCDSEPWQGEPTQTNPEGMVEAFWRLLGPSWPYFGQAPLEHWTRGWKDVTRILLEVPKDSSPLAFLGSLPL